MVAFLCSLDDHSFVDDFNTLTFGSLDHGVYAECCIINI